MEWYKYEEGKTIGNNGSENGTIIDDIESHEGARITLEKETHIAPFAILFGIYGLMFHTHYVSTEEEARDYIAATKEKLKGIFTHLRILEGKRDAAWGDRYNEFLSSLTE